MIDVSPIGERSKPRTTIARISEPNSGKEPSSAKSEGRETTTKGVENAKRDRKAETFELLRRYNQNPSYKLRNRIVEKNLGLVRREAHHWKNQCNESFDDLMQIGCVGLIRSIERFDLSRGLAFSSFATPAIRGEIQHYLRDKSSTVRIPRQWVALRGKCKKTTMRLQQELGRTPTSSEVREEMNLTEDEWRQFQLALQNQSTLSLDAPRGQGDGDGSLGDLVPDANYQSFQLAQEDRIRLRQAMSHLEERTRQVLEFVFLYDLTQKETAERLNMSAVTVYRRMRKGLSQMAHLLEPDETES